MVVKKVVKTTPFGSGDMAGFERGHADARDWAELAFGVMSGTLG